MTKLDASVTLRLVNPTLSAMRKKNMVQKMRLIRKDICTQLLTYTLIPFFAVTPTLIWGKTISSSQCPQHFTEFKPERKNGKIVGMKILPFTKYSCLQHFRLKPNDLLVRINSFLLTDTEQLYDLFRSIRTNPISSATLTRNGKNYKVKLRINEAYVKEHLTSDCTCGCKCNVEKAIDPDLIFSHFEMQEE